MKDRRKKPGEKGKKGGVPDVILLSCGWEDKSAISERRCNPDQPEEANGNRILAQLSCPSENGLACPATVHAWAPQCRPGAHPYLTGGAANAPLARLASAKHWVVFLQDVSAWSAGSSSRRKRQPTKEVRLQAKNPTKWKAKQGHAEL